MFVPMGLIGLMMPRWIFILVKRGLSLALIFREHPSARLFAAKTGKNADPCVRMMRPTAKTFIWKTARRTLPITAKPKKPAFIINP